MLLIELLAAMRIDHMAILVSEPSFLINRPALFVKKLTLRAFLEDWPALFVAIELALEAKRIEVVFLDKEWGGDLTAFVQFLLREHLLALHIFDDVPRPFRIQ